MFRARPNVNSGLTLVGAGNRREAPAAFAGSAALGPAEGDGPSHFAETARHPFGQSAAIAVMAHILLLGFFQAGLSWSFHPDDSEPKAIPVEVVRIDEVTRTEAQRQVTETPRPTPSPPPPPEPAPPVAETPPPAAAPPPAPPEPAVAALPPPAVVPTPAPAPPAAAPRPTPPPVAAPAVKPAAPSPALARARPRAKPEQPPDFDQLLRTLDNRARPQGTVAAEAREGATRAGPVPAPQPTATEIDAIVAAIKRQIERCWNPPVGAADAGELVVRLAVSVDPDGTVRRATVLSDGRGDSPYLVAAGESARRAVLNPQCNPLPLPRDRYDVWKELELSFNPKELTGR